MECPYCQSNHTQSFPSVYNQGTYVASSYNFDVGSTATTTRSRNASRCAPPIHPMSNIPFWMARIFLALMLGEMIRAVVTKFLATQAQLTFIPTVIVFSLGFVISLLLMNTIFIFLIVNYRNDQALWYHKFLCLRCDGDFIYHDLYEVEIGLPFHERWVYQVCKSIFQPFYTSYKVQLDSLYRATRLTRKIYWSLYYALERYLPFIANSMLVLTGFSPFIGLIWLIKGLTVFGAS